MTSSIIVAQDLVKKFDQFLAVDRIHFEIKEGECFGFLGPNGAGKTSTMRMIYCFSPVSSGLLTVLGKKVQSDAAWIKAQMGVVPQEDSLDPDLTVRDNLRMYARYFDIPKEEASLRADQLLDFLQLTDKKSEPISRLSGGMKRRLVIARALINRPKVLILDEPTTGLDPQARHLIWNKLRSLKKSGVTMVLTTHYMEEASQLCDRLLIMNEGKVLASGSPRDLIEKYVGEEVYEVRAPKNILENLKEKLKSHFEIEISDGNLFIFVRKTDSKNGEILSSLKDLDYHHRMASLEDVFLKVAGRELRE